MCAWFQKVSILPHGWSYWKFVEGKGSLKVELLEQLVKYELKLYRNFLRGEEVQKKTLPWWGGGGGGRMDIFWN